MARNEFRHHDGLTDRDPDGNQLVGAGGESDEYFLRPRPDAETKEQRFVNNVRGHANATDVTSIAQIADEKQNGKWELAAV